MICTVRDDFIEHYIETYPRWEVQLSNGEHVFQDDGRPGVDPASAWLRLYDYCCKHNVYIKDMLIGFRSNTYSLPSNMDGYFFSKGAIGVFGGTKTISIFFVGILKNNILEVTRWKVPEMLKEETEIRDIEKAGECLIQKNMSQFMEQKDPSGEINI